MRLHQLKSRKAQILTGVVVLVVLAFAWNYWRDYRETKATCVRVVNYAAASFYWIKEDGNTRRFKTYEEAMTYCMQEIQTLP